MNPGHVGGSFSVLLFYMKPQENPLRGCFFYSSSASGWNSPPYVVVWVQDVSNKKSDRQIHTVQSNLLNKEHLKKLQVFVMYRLKRQL